MLQGGIQPQGVRLADRTRLTTGWPSGVPETLVRVQHTGTIIRK